MTNPEQLDQMITRKQKGDVIVPQSSEEKLALGLMEFVESFDLDPEFDTALTNQFEKTPVRTIYSPKSVDYPVKSNTFLRVFMTSVAAMTIMSIAVFTIPPLHTLAQQIIDFFLPSDADKITVELHIGGSATTSTVDLYPLSLGELVSAVDFEIPLPTFIPSVYTFNGASYNANAQVVSLNYRCTDYWSIDLTQNKVTEPDMDNILSREVGVSAEVEQVMIGTAIGQYVRGSWIIFVDSTVVQQAEEAGTAVITDAEGRWGNSQWHQLIWYSEGMLYTLMGGPGPGTQSPNSSCSLDKADFVAIARGLQFVGSD